MSADSSSKEDADEYEKSNTNLPFLKFEHIAFESKLFEIVEELRLRRECDESNTIKIQQLIQQNFDMRKQQETSEKNFEKIKEEFEKYKLDMKKMYDCKLSVIEEEKVSNQMTVDCLKKEMETIKNESWSLQMEKLNLEKTIMELKTHLHVRNNLQESTHDQLGEIQNMFDKLNRNCCKLSKVQKCLREDVHHATTLCERVENLNTEYHEKLENIKDENEKIKQEIVKLRSQLQEEYYAKSVHQENIEVENLNLKIKFQEQELLSLHQLLNQAKEESDNKFKSLEESNRSLNKYINLFNEANSEKKNLLQKLDKTNLENKQLREKIQELQEKLNENYTKMKDENEVNCKNLNKEIQTITTKKINKLTQTSEEFEDENDFSHLKQILFSKFEQKCTSSKNLLRNSNECKQNNLISKEITLNDDDIIKPEKLVDQNEKLLKTVAEAIEIEYHSNQSINPDVSSKLQNDFVTSTSDNACRDDNCSSELKCSPSLNCTVPHSAEIQTEPNKGNMQIIEFTENQTVLENEEMKVTESTEIQTEPKKGDMQLIEFTENQSVPEKGDMQLTDIYKTADENNNSLSEYSIENGECSKSKRIHTVINFESLSPKKMKMNDLLIKFKSIPIDSQIGNENANLTNNDCGKNYFESIEECNLLVPIPSFINKKILQLKETNIHKDSSFSDSHETDSDVIKEHKNTASKVSDSNVALSSKELCRNMLGATSLSSVLRERSEFSIKRFFDNSLMKEWSPPMKKFNISLDNNSIKK